MNGDKKQFPSATFGSSSIFGAKPGDASNASNTFSSSTTLFKTDKAAPKAGGVFGNSNGFGKSSLGGSQTGTTPTTSSLGFGTSGTTGGFGSFNSLNKDKKQVDFNPFGLNAPAAEAKPAAEPKKEPAPEASSSTSPFDSTSKPEAGGGLFAKKPSDNFGLNKGEVPKAFGASAGTTSAFGSGTSTFNFGSKPASEMKSGLFARQPPTEEKAEPSTSLFGEKAKPAGADAASKQAAKADQPEKNAPKPEPKREKKPVAKWEAENKKLLPELKKSQEKAKESAKEFKPIDFTPVINMLIEEIWGTYDSNKDGKLQKEEARVFIKRIVEKTDSKIDEADKNLKKKDSALPGKQFDSKFKEFWDKYDFNKDNTLSKAEMAGFLHDVIAV